MKRKIGIFIGLFLCTIPLLAKTPPRINTIYKDGRFQTVCSVMVNCPMQTCVQTVDDFVAQFVGDPNALFDWALKGMGKSDDETRNEILLVLKEATYDKLSGMSRLIVDVHVANVMSLTDQIVDSKITQLFENDGSYRVYVDILYSNSLLKKADGIFFVKPISNNQTELKVQVNIKFGWFFNIFVTQRRYKNMFEWRCMGFMDNMRNEMERRCAP